MPAPRVLTRPEVRTQAAALTGARSRVNLAATTDDPPAAPQPDESTGELWLYGLVGGYWRGFDAESVANAIRGMDVDVLYVRIHSPGGWAEDGIAIANLLRNHRARVVIIVDGIAASAASVIAIAGDEIIMCPGSRLMLHDASTYGYGNAASLRAAADDVDACSVNYAGVYAYRAGGTAASWREVMLANNGLGTWYTADEAVTAGLADQVGTVVAVGSPPVAPEDELDDDDTWARAMHDLMLLEQCVPPAVSAAWRGDTPDPRPRPRTGNPTTQEGSPAVAFSDEQVTTMRQQLGIAEDADEATILAALGEALTERADPAAATTTTQVPEGMTLIETDALAILQAGATAGTAARDQQLTEHRDRTITAAIADGRITPARREHWTTTWAADPEGTEQLLGQLPKGLVPTSEIGHDAGGSDAHTPYDDLYGSPEQKGA